MRADRSSSASPERDTSTSTTTSTSERNVDHHSREKRRRRKSADHGTANKPRMNKTKTSRRKPSSSSLLLVSSSTDRADVHKTREAQIKIPSTDDESAERRRAKHSKRADDDNRTTTRRRKKKHEQSLPLVSPETVKPSSSHSSSGRDSKSRSTSDKSVSKSKRKLQNSKIKSSREKDEPLGINADHGHPSSPSSLDASTVASAQDDEVDSSTSKRRSAKKHSSRQIKKKRNGSTTSLDTYRQKSSSSKIEERSSVSNNRSLHERSRVSNASKEKRMNTKAKSQQKRRKENGKHAETTGEEGGVQMSHSPSTHTAEPTPALSTTTAVSSNTKKKRKKKQKREQIPDDNASTSKSINKEEESNHNGDRQATKKGPKGGSAKKQGKKSKKRTISSGIPSKVAGILQASCPTQNHIKHVSTATIDSDQVSRSVRKGSKREKKPKVAATSQTEDSNHAESESARISSTLASSTHNNKRTKATRSQHRSKPQHSRRRRKQMDAPETTHRAVSNPTIEPEDSSSESGKSKRKATLSTSAKDLKQTQSPAPDNNSTVKLVSFPTTLGGCAPEPPTIQELQPTSATNNDGLEPFIVRDASSSLDQKRPSRDATTSLQDAVSEKARIEVQCTNKSKDRSSWRNMLPFLTSSSDTPKQRMKSQSGSTSETDQEDSTISTTKSPPDWYVRPRATFVEEDVNSKVMHMTFFETFPDEYYNSQLSCTNAPAPHNQLNQ